MSLLLRPGLNNWIHHGVFTSGGVAEAGFVGAYDDIPNITAAYGMRRLLSSYESNLLRIRRGSDNVEQDFGYVENGDLDVDAVATFIGGGSGLITTWYDQKNANNALQTTAAAQPLYVASGQNSLPVLRWDGVDDGLISGTLPASLVSLTAITVLDLRRPFPHSQQIDAYLAQNVNWATAGFGMYLTNYFGSTSDTFANIEPTNANEAMWENGVALTLNAVGNYGNTGYAVVSSTVSPSTPTDAGFSIGKGLTSVQWEFNGDIGEMVLCDAILSTANREAAEAAANSYWAVY